MSERACVILWADSNGHDPQPIYFGTDEWRASLDWARFFGIDPMRVVAGEVIVVDREKFTIGVHLTRLDDDGKLILRDGDPVTDLTVIHLEGPALPVGHPAIPTTDPMRAPEEAE